MTALTIEKNYKNLESRLESLEKILKVFLEDKLATGKIGKLNKISENLDKGAGNRFYFRQEFPRYLKSLLFYL